MDEMTAKKQLAGALRSLIPDKAINVDDAYDYIVTQNYEAALDKGLPEEFFELCEMFELLNSMESEEREI